MDAAIHGCVAIPVELMKNLRDLTSHEGDQSKADVLCGAWIV